MRSAELRRPPGLAEPLLRVLADRGEHGVALFSEPNEALVDERMQAVEIRAGDLLRGFERAAACEHRQRAEEALLFRRRVGRSSNRSSPAACAAAPARRARRRSAAASSARAVRGSGPARAPLLAPPPAPAPGAGSRAVGRSQQRAVVLEPGRAARAREKKKPTASSSTNGGTGYSCSPARRSGSRLVTSNASLGQDASSSPSAGAASTNLLEVVQHKQHLPVGDVRGEIALRSSVEPIAGRTSAAS